MPKPSFTPDGPPNPAMAAKLVSVAHQAYVLYPKNYSGSVHYVITRLIDPKAPYRLANQLMQWLASPASGWRQVSSWQQASQLANQGAVVIAGRIEPGGHGHVLIVLPGPWKRSGGYTVDGKVMAFHGLYPPAMSTSLGSWPGATSDGDKTVYDPWANEEQFRQVTIWARKTP